MIQIEQMPIDTAISDALFTAMPDHWTETTLVARKKSSAPGTDSYSITLSGKPVGGVAFVSDELEAKVRELFLLHKKHGTGLLEARYMLRQRKGQWNLESEFEYEDDDED